MTFHTDHFSFKLLLLHIISSAKTEHQSSFISKTEMKPGNGVTLIRAIFLAELQTIKYIST